MFAWRQSLQFTFYFLIAFSAASVIDTRFSTTQDGTTPTVTIYPTSSSSVSTGAIVGISIAVFLALVTALAGCGFLLYRRQHSNPANPPAAWDHTMPLPAWGNRSSPTLSFGQPTPPPAPDPPPAELPDAGALNSGPAPIYPDLQLHALAQANPVTRPPLVATPPADAPTPVPSPSRSSKRSSRSRRPSNASQGREARGPQAGQPYYSPTPQRVFPRFQGYDNGGGESQAQGGTLQIPGGGRGR